MSTPNLNTGLAPSIRALLDALRSRIRQYIWIEGLACAVIWLGVAFWITLVFDWFFEPSRPVRVLQIGLVVLGFIVVVVRQIGRRLVVPLTDANMATLLERRFPQLGDSLLTAVDLSPRNPSHDGFHPEMYERTCGEAVERIHDLRVNEVFRFQPLRRAVLGAVLLTFGIMLFGIVAPRSLSTWARRTLAFSNELWPRSCKLEIDGFPNGVRKIARGSDVDISVRALPAESGLFVIPDSVEIRYREENGTRGRAMMEKVGEMDPAKHSFQPFTHTRRSVLSPIHFEVRGGDAVLDHLLIQVVDSPNVVGWSLECRYPKYIGREKRMLPVTGVTPIPQGTQVTVHATANKPLERVQIDRLSGEKPDGQPIVLPSEQLSSDRLHFSTTIPALDTDTTLLVTLFDTDGIKSHEPIRLALLAVADQPPQIAAQLDGIGSAITPKARIPVLGRMTDDYGLGERWFEYHPDAQAPARSLFGKAVENPTGAPTEFLLEGQALDIEKLGLRPGQKFQVVVKGSDLCTLGKAPHVGQGETWTLDVVAPEQLRAILEGRELVLRQHFERLMQEMTETRDLLARAKFDRTESANADDSEPAGATSDKPTKTDVRNPAPGQEPGDEPAGKATPPSLERLMARVQNALTNCMKNTQETLGLADSFEDLRKQLVNNRIDTEEYKERLQLRIADPLRKIAREMFPELEHRLELLETSLEQGKLDPKERDRAKEQADAILLAMQKVLDRMLELEDYNQMVELLRDVIKMQDELGTQIEQRQKQKIRDLLKE